MNAWVLVALGGCLGAMARYGVGLWMGGLVGAAFPFPTLAINIAGSLALGWLAGMASHASPAPQLLLGTGFLGAFTTFSTFSVETLRLLEAGRPTMALLYVVASVTGGLAAALVGLTASRSL